MLAGLCLFTLAVLLGFGDLMYFLYLELGKELPIRHTRPHQRVAHR